MTYATVSIWYDDKKVYEEKNVKFDKAFIERSGKNGVDNVIDPTNDEDPILFSILEEEDFEMFDKDSTSKGEWYIFPDLSMNDDWVVICTTKELSSEEAFKLSKAVWPPSHSR